VSRARPHSAERGFSLVELLVAVAVSLIVLGGVIAVMVSSKATYVTQDSLARLQENARFATEFIARDLRMAGYFGCADDLSSVSNHVNNSKGEAGDIGDLWSTKIPLEGMDSTNQALWYPSNVDWIPGDATANQKPAYLAPNTDAVIIRYMNPSDILVVTPFMPNVSAAVHITANSGLRKGDIILVTDCSSSDVFQITGPDQNNVDNGTLNHNTGVSGVSPGNAVQALSKTYEGDAFVAKLEVSRYFVGVRNLDGTLCTTNCKCDRQHLCGLFRQGVGVTGATAAQEIVEGVENLQVLYGEDTDSDRLPNRYVTAATLGTDAKNWANIVSIRIGLLMSSLADSDYTAGAGGKPSAAGAGGLVREEGVALDSGPHTVLGTAFSVANGNLEARRVQRRVFETTIFLRNIK